MMLGDGTASVAGRELGRDFDNDLICEPRSITVDNRKKVDVFINSGHKWGGATHIGLLALGAPHPLRAVRRQVGRQREHPPYVALGHRLVHRQARRP
eukprot:2048036-Rhodomonas_salina.1